jgi:hypothetical protein
LKGIAVRALRITCPALLCSLGFAALGLPPAAAQNGGQRQRVNQPADRSAPGLTPPARTLRESAVDDASGRYFFDDFSTAAPDRRKWDVVVGVTPVGGLPEAEGATNAIRLGLDPHATDGAPELCSVPIPLWGATEVELAYTVWWRGVDVGEGLAVEYLTSDGHWNTVERLVSDGRDPIEFSRRTHLLPADALHGEFRIRFRPLIDDEDDAWFLGDVMVAGDAPLETLTVRMQPAREARIELVLAGRTDEMSVSVPFTGRFPVSSRLYLIPPPTTAEGVFSHWSMDGGVRIQRQRVLALDMSESVETVAHYRPWVSGRDEASVAIISAPLPGVPIALGTEPEALFTHLDAGAEYPCLTGERLALLAPRRTERMVFVGWVVNGEKVPGSDNLLDHHVSGDDVLLAEYLLLGDVNGDDVLDKYDVDLFVAALIDPLGYAEVYPELDRVRRGDINGDGVFDALDVEGFVDLLLND